jgi:hypothetical protein
MSNIQFHGVVNIPPEVIAYADSIKLENYKTNTPAKFQIRTVIAGEMIIDGIAAQINIPSNKLDFVYFSVAKGAEPHTDLLHPDRFEDTTYVIPVILPNGKSIITAEDEQVEVELGGVYQFDHTKIHSMVLEDNTSGCVVIMVAVLKDTATQ